MKHEKSCGAVVFRINAGQVQILLIKHKHGGHWSFPKGHVEKGESETDTALREIREETGLTVSLLDGFREVVEYFPKPDVQKQVVYFLAQEAGGNLHRQEEEVSDIRFTSPEDAYHLVTYDNDRSLLKKAQAVLDKLMH